MSALHLSPRITRRALLLSSAAVALARPGRASAHGTHVLRIGVQRSAIMLMLLKQRGGLQRHLPKHEVSWAEFPAGPQLLEALAVGELDLGMTGDAPPVFAQAAGKELIYVGAEPPKPRSSAIIVKAGSRLRTLVDLRGHSIALQKNSSAHFLLARAVAKAGLRFGDIKPVYLAPADARAAFEGGDVDAWAIWDPFYAVAESAIATRVLSDGVGLCNNNSFYLASRAMVETQPETLRAVFAALAEIDTFVRTKRAEAERLYAAISGLEPSTVKRLLDRRPPSPVAPLDAAQIADQQRVADTFLSLKLIPSRIRVADVVWMPK